MKKAIMQSVHTLLKLAQQLRLICNVTRMPDERLPKNVFYGDLQEGKRSRGGQIIERYKDTLKSSLREFNIPTDFLCEQAALDRTKLCCIIREGAAKYEAKIICESERKYKERLTRTKGSSSQSLQPQFTCLTCNRHFKAKTGLYSHQRTQNHR